MAQFYKCEPSGDGDLKSYKEYNDKNYPKAIVIGPATGKYNCHSFAWNQGDTSNHFWINEPKGYWNDGSATLINGDGAATKSEAKGTRWTYDDDKGVILHTAVVWPNAGKPVTSKWGKAPLYAHDLKYVPYDIDHMRSYTYDRSVVTFIKDRFYATNGLSYRMADGILIVTPALGAPAPGTVEIFDMGGRSLYRKAVFAPGAFTLDIRNLSRGAYALTVGSGTHNQAMPLEIR